MCDVVNGGVCKPAITPVQILCWTDANNVVQYQDFNLGNSALNTANEYGFYDMQGTGMKTDFCRWIGSGGNPSQCAYSGNDIDCDGTRTYFACHLSGTGVHISWVSKVFDHTSPHDKRYPERSTSCSSTVKPLYM